jgi:AraC-like DNA-binding protein
MEGEFILLPKAANMRCRADEESELIVFSFDSLHYVCDKAMLDAYLPIAQQITADFIALPIRPLLDAFLNLLFQYAKVGMDCEHLHEIKEKELFLLLRNCYSAEEITVLLHPLIGNTDFKGFVLGHYRQVRGVQELANMSGMGRTAFDCKFKQTFGLSARQWMLKQTAQHIRYRIMDPEVTAKDLMNEFKFNSATHFNRFCRAQFGCTPGELLRKNRQKSVEMDGNMR